MTAPLRGAGPADTLDDARRALDSFVDTLNSHDVEAWADTMHFPHLRIHDTVSTVWTTRAEYLDSGARELRALLSSGWVRSGWDSVDVVHAHPDQVHFATRFTRYDAAGTALSRLDTVYVVVRRDGRWGTVARLGFVLDPAG